MCRTCRVCVLAGLAAFGASAQPVDSPPRFEVAAIKRCDNLEPPRGGAISSVRLDLACVTTANLICLAYLVFPTGERNAPVSPSIFQMPISGGPSWIDSERYWIDAKTERPVNVEMMKGPMMQALLEERFKLRLHREAKEISVYELTVGKDGANLQPARAGACVALDRNSALPESAPVQSQRVVCGSIVRSTRGGFDIAGVTLPELCRLLSGYVDREIIDKTGMQGVFDVHLDLSPADLGFPDGGADPISPEPGDGAALGSALKKLGLKMSLAKSSMQLLVIDHIERPSAN